MGGLCTSSISTDVRHRNISQSSKPEASKSSQSSASSQSIAGDSVGSETKAAVVAPPEVKIDPKDLIASKLDGHVLIREPGTIRGQQFVIEDCKNCDIMLLDNSAAVTIDDCEGCRIYVGPCESSVFIRNTKNCRVVVACQQLRLRDCVGCDLMVAVCAGQPVIESSRGIRFACFNYSYFSLRAQFAAALLSPWNNEWSNIHDFTHSDSETHWTYMPIEAPESHWLRPLKDLESSTVESTDWVVPMTHGNRPRPSSPTSPPPATQIVFVYDPHHAIASDLIDRLRPQLTSGSLVLMRTRLWKKLKSNPNQIAQLAGKDKVMTTNLTRGPAIVLEFYASSAADLTPITTAIHELVPTDAPNRILASTTPALAAKWAENVFATIKM